MKKKLALILFILTVAFNFKVSATIGQPEGKVSNYVVIGAFSIPKNAVDFTNGVKGKIVSAEFSINPNRKLFYVYTFSSSSQRAAIEEAKKIRKGTPYTDAWVFTGILGEDQPASSDNGIDTNPDTGEAITKIESTDDSKNLASNASLPTASPVPTVATTLTQDSPNSETNTNTSIEPPAADGSKRFFFKIFADQKEIQGDIDLMDLDFAKPKKLATYRGNESVLLKPVNKTGNIEFVCQVFGYRKIQTIINFNKPDSTEGVILQDNKTVVPFELVRLKKGDFAVMYNVYFFIDAGIMRPESKYEINSLLDMLKENPRYKIRIHGHTNGNDRGKVISMGESKNFFAITADVKEGKGSAKKLSEERALVIQNYLINQGIEANRMQIKAWGGKRPIYDEDHTLAKANVRVEIEILED